MTPAQLEHLKLIDTHLERLLAIADKRTPGDYVKLDTYVGSKDNHHGIADCCYCGDSENEDNAAFIASCAGNAEAGWMATRSMIDYLLMMHKHGEGHRYIGLAEDIRAAFPLELIQKP